MIEHIKRTFGALSPLERAAKELHEAELALLDSLSRQEFAYAEVKYNEQRVSRLRSYVKSGGRT